MKLGLPLSSKGIVLEKKKLEEYLEKIASDHVLQNYSSKETYPIPRLKDNFEIITKTYDLLNSHIKIGIPIHPAGEWILDNYYIVEEEVKQIIQELSLKKYINFLGIANGNDKGYARIYVLACEIVAYTNGCIESKNISNYIKAYQSKKTLNMEEIWNINLFFKIALIDNIANVCSKIYWSQMQKYKVENILERLVENKSKNNQTFKMTKEYKNDIKSNGEMKYPFIEYMSYRLKKYGKKSNAFLKILEEQVNKMGTTINEVIKKEHFDIAVKKVLIGNCIKSIKNLQTMNFLEIFEKINGVEEILKKDPANIYIKMDYKTKEYYRNTIKEMSKKTKISELYIARKALELSQKAKAEDNLEQEFTKNKKIHIGYYLISDGKKLLIESLQINTRKKIKVKTNESKAKQYISLLVFLTGFIDLIFTVNIYFKSYNILLTILTFIFLLLPISEIVTQGLQYILNKIVKPKLIPKLDLSQGVPEELATMVIIPTIIKDEKKVKSLLSKLEVYYLANKSENIYFTLLGDCSSSSKQEENYDKKIIETGKKEIQRLNKKYPKLGLGKFQFIYRKRTWNKKEKAYLGWERKRGFINQFNEFLLGNKQSDFLCNTIEEYKKKEGNNKIPFIKYVITLDADTDLVLNSGLELIGAMSHILNLPVLNNEKTVVIDGHAIMQPRVGIDLEIVKMSLFTKIFAGLGGKDSYTNAISDTYQDNFGEGIFTGKGIYDLEIFETVLNNQIPENTVLSHDLLEGNYLRCALVSDIVLMDGYPYKYNSFITRLHRWIRGDWQISIWLKKKIKNREGKLIKNPLNLISKFKILDNLRRSILEIFCIIGILFFLSIGLIYNFKIWIVISLIIISIIMPTVLDYINYIVFKKEGMKKQKTFEESLSILQASFLRGIISISFLPHKAYISLQAIIKTIYRMCISKEHLLEWTTSEEAEHILKTNLMSFYSQMLPNVIFSTLLIILVKNYNNMLNIILGNCLTLLWLIGPIIAWYISMQNKETKMIEKLSQEEIQYIMEVGNKTWQYFYMYMNKENNYLPPDNFQEDRRNKIVNRTSSTNIGLGLLSIVSAYDLGYIDEKACIDLLEKSVDTITKLSKWNGHLYNWYNTKTMEPLIPRYISSVDSGNFIGYLYTLKQFLEEKNNNEKVSLLISQINYLIDNTDFSILYSNEKGLFSIGFDVEANKLTDTYYDLLASEARQASFIAIAKKDVPAKHWENLSRTLTILGKYKGLISWSGTSFEYLMPNINMKRYPGSLLDESSKFMIMSQEKYAKKMGTPWGISESAFNLKDLNGNYQYKAFGIPWLGLKRGLGEERVISTYGSVLAITDEPNKVIDNLKYLEQNDMYGKYGFYESIDYTPERVPYGKKNMPVKTYMAHHQALILLSINNLINENILQERFMANPEIKAVNVLLEERMPENLVITKERKEKIEKVKYLGYDHYAERVYTKINPNIENGNIISNEKYCTFINDKGEGFSKFKNVIVNRFKETSEEPQGIFFYIKNIKSKRIWTSFYQKDETKPDKYEIHFMPDQNKIIRNDENIETTVKMVLAPEQAVEIRTIELKNTGNNEEVLEVTGVLEPVISIKNQDYAHMAFNNLFLKYEILEDTKSILIKRNKRGNVDPIYLGVNLYSEESVGEIEYEVDKEKLYDKENSTISKMIQNSLPFSKKIGLVTDPIVALKRTVKIMPGETVKLNLVIGVSENKEEVKNMLLEYKNIENVKRVFDLSKARVEEEARYLGISGKDIVNYQKMLTLLLFQNPMKKMYIRQLPKKEYKQQELWKYGVSGDLPILLVKVKDNNDISLIKECLKAYEYFRIKNVYIDFIIINEEENTYEQYVKEAVEEEILNRNLAYLKNCYGGIFVLNKNEIEEEGLFEFVSNLWIKSEQGDLDTNLKDKEDEYLESIKNIGFDKSQEKMLPQLTENLPKIDMENLEYYNEYGGFTKDGLEYKMKVNKNHVLPTTWSHVLANKNFGTILTQNMGGYTWSKNSRLNRLTAWSNNSLFDTPSEIIYLKDKKYGISWSLGKNPKPDDEDYYITYGFGYANYYHYSLGIEQKLDVFIPRNDNIKVNLLKLKNTTSEKRKLKLVYYLKPVLGEDEIKTNGFIDMKFNKNIIYAKNMYKNELGDFTYVSCSEKISSFTGDKKEFIGYGNLKNPDGLNKVEFSNENSLGQNSCIAIDIELEIEPYDTKELVLLLGEGNKIVDIQDTVYKYSEITNCTTELENVKKYWIDLLKKVKVKTPVESMNIMLNGWLMYQTIVCRLWARTGFYQSGGAFGFRDQLQDTLGVKYICPEIMKDQIIKHASHQFIEGDVEHWWHEIVEKGIRTKFSDDLLWLVFVTEEYIDFTGDISILEKKAPYLEGKLLEGTEDERYEVYRASEIDGTIYEHCNKAILKAQNFGENGLPKIGSGDWNDGFSTVGNRGKGESVWLGFFMYYILDKWIPICKQKQDEQLAREYELVKDKLKKALNTNGWDGRWFKRAFTDDGDILGSIENEECRIDSISQSWSVISNAGDNDKKYISMESLENHLVDKENGIIKLLDPPFEKGNIEPGYIKAYLPGVRENGGQYTHVCYPCGQF